MQCFQSLTLWLKLYFKNIMRYPNKFSLNIFSFKIKQKKCNFQCNYYMEDPNHLFAIKSSLSLHLAVSKMCITC